VREPDQGTPCESPELRGLRRIARTIPEHLLQFLHAERSRLHRDISVPRPWHYAELHNPWARAATAYDSWGFLDICQYPPLLEAVAKLLGPDIILFDSQWLPETSWEADDASAPESDAHRFPVDPLRGLTVLIVFADVPRATLRIPDTAVNSECAPIRGESIVLDVKPGDVLLVDAQTPYRVQTEHAAMIPAIYAIRYFSAQSLFNRHPSAPVHRALVERYPLFNYAKMPLWLVHGEDRAGNDFVTGFDVRAGFWTAAQW
jgi:hypothetical protein